MNVPWNQLQQRQHSIWEYSEFSLAWDAVQQQRTAQQQSAWKIRSETRPRHIILSGDCGVDSRVTNGQSHAIGSLGVLRWPLLLSNTIAWGRKATRYRIPKSHEILMIVSKKALGTGQTLALRIIYNAPTLNVLKDSQLARVSEVLARSPSDAKGCSSPAQIDLPAGIWLRRPPAN